MVKFVENFFFMLEYVTQYFLLLYLVIYFNFEKFYQISSQNCVTKKESQVQKFEG